MYLLITFLASPPGLHHKYIQLITRRNNWEGLSLWDIPVSVHVISSLSYIALIALILYKGKGKGIRFIVFAFYLIIQSFIYYLISNPPAFTPIGIPAPTI